MHTKLAPVAPHKRLVPLDCIRGLALLGILLVNVLVFAYPIEYYPPLAYPHLSYADRMAEWGVRVLAQGVFYPIFAVLFGVGMAIQQQRARRNGRSFFWIHLRRMLLLGILGGLHGMFIWKGDILTLYSCAGLVMLLFIRLPLRSSVVVMVIGWLVTFGAYLWSMQQFGEGAQRSAEILELIYPSRSWDAIQQVRSTEFLNTLSFSLIFILPHTLALMLLGYQAFKHGVFHQDQRAHVLKEVVWISLVVTLFTRTPDALAMMRGLEQPFWRASSYIIGGTAQGIGYIALWLLILRVRWMQQLFQPLAAVGRMALTNYLMQSVVLSLVFYGYGFGVYSHRGAVWALVMALLVYSMQILLSHAWLSRYRHGMLEWLWRIFTYGTIPYFKYQSAPSEGVQSPPGPTPSRGAAPGGS